MASAHAIGRRLPKARTMITSDWRIHSRNSCDEACISIADLIRPAAEKGVEDYAVTDHVHAPRSFADIETSRVEFLANRPSTRSLSVSRSARCRSGYSRRSRAGGTARRSMACGRAACGWRLAIGATGDAAARIGRCTFRWNAKRSSAITTARTCSLRHVRWSVSSRIRGGGWGRSEAPMGAERPAGQVESRDRGSDCGEHRHGGLHTDRLRRKGVGPGPACGKV